MPTSDGHADEVRRLRDTMRDLVALSTLPAVWTGYEPDGVVRSLARVLCDTLALDLIYVRGLGGVEAACGSGFVADAAQLVTIAGALAPWHASDPPAAVADPLGGADLRVAVSRFGYAGDLGVVVACSRRADFPNESDRLLLGVGANQTAIVLQRKRAERALAEERQRLHVTLSSIGDAVIATDVEGRVAFMNGVAEALTGWSGAEARGVPLPEVFRIVNESTRRPNTNPALRALSEGAVVGLANHTVLVSRDGTERPIDDSAAPIRDGAAAPTGAVLVFRDVTERRRAEEAKARLAAIVESSADAIVSKSLDGVVRSWNAGAERLFGYTAAEAVGRPITLVIPPERREEEPRILERLRRGERVEHFETIRLTKDGRRIDVSLTISPILDAGGAVVGASKVARDITARKRAELALREREERLRRMVNVEGVGVLVWGLPEGRLIGSNDYFLRMFGYSRAEAESGALTWRDMTPPEYVAESERQMAAFAATGRLGPYEKEYLRKDGSRAWMLFAGAALGDREVVEYCIDVSDRKRVEAEAAQLTERLRLALDAGDLGTWEWDPATDEMSVSARASEMYGTPSGVPHGRELGRQLIHPEDRERARAVAARAVAERADYDIEYRLADRPVWVAAHGRGLYDATGKLVRVYGVVQDVTVRKRAEIELRDQDRKKDDFIALLAHELRNPLAPIRNGLQVLRLGGAHPDAAARARDMMDRQLAHMVRLIDDLLDVSRINRGKMELRRSRVELADVVGSAVETARPALDAEGHELMVTLPATPVPLDADLTRLAQVFANLLTNSAKYTPKGGRIWLTADRTDGHVVVAVRDTGIGIPKESLPTIFDMFSQVDRSVEKSTGGLGIGLALVKGLVEMHGGEVTAASDGEGAGTTFTVVLPVAAKAEAAPPAAVAAPPRGPARRILVVDDNRDGAESMADMLGLLGHEVVTANDGLDAIGRADAFRPDVILMDVGMPRLNGLDATRRIRERDWGRAIAIVALTGWGQENDRERSREAGCDAHLVKPVDFADLQRVLAEVANG